MNGEEFKEGDLMPWQEMTRAIKNLQVFNDEHTTRLQDMERKISMLELKIESNKTSEMLYARKIKELEEILKSYFGEFPSKRIFELEARVDSLTRSLDILQEVTGVEVVVTPEGGNSGFEASELRRQESTHEGQCEVCDRIAPLNSGNICEGCFLGELYDEQNIAL